MKFLITGGAGFIGSAFVRLAAGRGHKVILADSLNYAGDLKRIKGLGRKCVFYKADICDKGKMGSIFKKERPEIVVNFAAQTHVDRSILDCGIFLKTNILGTKVLIDLCREYSIKRFVHISTDEVYGDIEKGKFREDFPLKPNSPYAASKASADLLVRSYVRTYGFPAIIVRPSNNYGPWQYPEKLIPLAILKILKGGRIPVYATGRNIREWLFVEDCARGIMQVIGKGRLKETYNLGSNEEKRNIDVVRSILDIMGVSYERIEFVKDRPGHDIRYSLNSTKIYKDTGWSPKVKFNQGIRQTVQWCIDNKDWLFSKYSRILRLYSK
ncbi:MAG: dTDP-glucose 4,6-dehydratase [Candidatus Omnitrophica bacterium]|nr:dTDP-glucose 4,6-dehydratase [Candidatus Omnitrophota bacterium]